MPSKTVSPTSTESQPSRASSLRQSFVRLTNLVVALSCTASATAIVAPNWWVGDLCANLRVQWVVAPCGALTVMLAAANWKTAVVCLCTAAANSAFIVGGLGWLASDVVVVDSNAPTCISVCTFNVLTTNQSFDLIERQLLSSDADVIVVPELSDGLERHLSGSRFEECYPHRYVDPQNQGNFGIGLYSRHPLTSANLFFLNGQIPSIEVWLSRDNRDYYVVATHTVPPIGKQRFDHRNKHLELLADKVREVAAASPKTSLIVAGDFNLTPWSPLFTGFCANANLQRTGGGLQPTWYRFAAFPFGLVLDHVLTSGDLYCHRYAVAEEAGSDHRMVVAKFTREP